MVEIFSAFIPIFKNPPFCRLTTLAEEQFFLNKDVKDAAPARQTYYRFTTIFLRVYMILFLFFKNYKNKIIYTLREKPLRSKYDRRAGADRKKKF